MNKIFNKVGNFAQTAVDKSKGAVDIARLNLKITHAEEEIKAIYATIGEYVVKEELLKDHNMVVDTCHNIQQLQKSIAADKETISHLKNVTTCQHCKEEIANNSKFCPKCGTPTIIIETVEEAEAKAPTTLCSQCGMEIHENNQFCTNCGKSRE